MSRTLALVVRLIMGLLEMLSAQLGATNTTLQPTGLDSSVLNLETTGQ